MFSMGWGKMIETFIQRQVGFLAFSYCFENFVAGQLPGFPLFAVDLR